MTRPPVVVVGLDCATGLQTARLFAARGIDVIGVAADPRHPCTRTRSCRRLVMAPRDPEGLVAELLELGRRLDQPAVLLPCTDLAVLGVSRHRSELAAYYRHAVPEPAVTETLLDKARFAEFATACALPIPTTHVIRDLGDARTAARETAYPCILKPAVKSVRWGVTAPTKVVVVESARALVDIYSRHADCADAFVVQELVHGGDEDHYTCDCYLGGDGQPLVTFCARKLRQWPPVGGQGCLSVEHRNDVVRDLTVRLFQAAGHHGQGYLEVKRDARTGRHLILEANVGRPTGRAAAAEKAGVELLMTMYNDLAGMPLPSERTQRFVGTKWIHIRHDLQACARLLVDGRIGWRELLDSWRGPFAFALFSPRDPMPFVADWVRAVGQGLGRRLRAGRSTETIEASRGGAEPAPARPPSPPTPQAPALRASSGVPSPGRAAVVDFALHGALAVRTLDAAPADLAAVSRELGRADTRAEVDADIVICFVDELRPSDVEPLNGNGMAYGDGGLYYLDRTGGRPLAHIRQGERWGQALIVCRRGLGCVPLLSTAIDLAALAHGWVPLHASGWALDGAGVIAAGGAGSGKTGALLAACRNGAAPLADDHVLMSKDGRSMVGLGRSMTLRDWHIAQLGRSAAPVSLVRRTLATASARLLGGHAGSGDSAGNRLPPWLTKSARRVVSGLRRRAGVEIALERVGVPNGTSARPDLVVLLETRRQATVVAEPIDPGAAAARLAAAVEGELMPPLRHQMSLGSALRRHGWSGLERVPDVASTLLHEAIRGKATYVVTHPPECALDELHEVIAGLLPADRTTERAKHDM